MTFVFVATASKEEYSSVRGVWRDGNRHFLSSTMYYPPKMHTVSVGDEHQRERTIISGDREITPAELTRRNCNGWTWDS